MNRRFILIYVLIFVISACSKPVDENQLISSLKSHKKTLEPIAKLLLGAGENSIIDLRDEPVRIKPSSITQQATPEIIQKLKHANVSFVSYDGSFNGVIFEVSGKGIGISGSSSGYLYQEEKPIDKDVEMVSHLQTAFDLKKSEMVKHESLDVKLVQVVEGNWRIYLETF